MFWTKRRVGTVEGDRGYGTGFPENSETLTLPGSLPFGTEIVGNFLDTGGRVTTETYPDRAECKQSLRLGGRTT